MKARAFFFLLPGGVAAGLTAALVDAGVKSGILLLLACVAVVALRKSAAATRHVVWTAAMACALAMPILSVCLPQWRVLPSWMGSERAAREVGSLTAMLPPLPTDSQVQVQQTSGAQGETSTMRNDLAPAASKAESPALASLSKQRIGPDFSASTAVLLGWAIGAGLLLLSLLRSAWSLHRLSRRSHIVANGVLAETLKEVAHELQLRQSVTLHAGSADAMPMVWGVWRAHLLLPSSAEHWLPARLRAVMLHELAHVRRRDPLTLMLAHLARAIHWFNPLAWVAVHRLRVEQEQACDDYVLRAGVKPSDYASAVLEIATALRVAPATASMALSMASPARLENRLRVIVEAASNRTALTKWAVAGAVIAAIVIALPLAMVRAADEKPEANTNKPSAFGPVIERTVNDMDSRMDESFIDLDSGRLFSWSDFGTEQPAQSLISGDETKVNEFRKRKIDLIGDASSQSLIGYDIVIVPTDERFDVVTAQSAAADKRLAGAAQDRVVITPRTLHPTYLFNTREGGRGVLEIVRFSNNDQGVEIRYKLVQEPGVADAPTGRAQAPTFGAVIEVPLKKTEGVKEEFLDLDTGRRVTRSALLAGALRDWARAEKMDVILHDMDEHQSGNGKVSIRTFDILVAAAPSSRWETATAQEILAHRLTEKSPGGASGEAHPALPGREFTYLQPESDNTDTYIFQTRENSRGMLQVIGSAKDSGGMKIRYKLVQQPGTAADARAAVEPTPSGSIAASGKSSAFGPVVERTVSDITSGNSAESFLDLDTGELFAESGIPRSPEQQDWWQPVDFMGEASKQAFAVHSMVLVPAEERFDSVPVERIDERLTGLAGKSQLVQIGEKLPATYLFKTREGGRGVLEVVRYNGFLSMDIRYKLVRAQREFELRTVLFLPATAGSKRFLNLSNCKAYEAKPADVPVAYLDQDLQEGRCLIIEGIHNYRTEAEVGAKLWETMSAEEIAQPAGLAAVPFERKGIYRVHSQDLPSVVLIPQWGLLRIASFDDRTSRVILEYKRVAAEGQPNAGKPAESEKRRTSRDQSAEDAAQGSIELAGARKEAQSSDPSGNPPSSYVINPITGNAELASSTEEAARVRLQQAEAGLERLTKLHADNMASSESLEEAKFAVETARAELNGDHGEAARIRLRKAEAGLERLTKLHADKVASNESFEEAKFAVEIARAELSGDHGEVARIRLRKAEAGLERLTKLHADKVVSSESFEEAKFAVEIARAELSGDHGQVARIRLRKAEAGLERLTKLHADKMASSESFEEAKFAVEIARAELNGDHGEVARIRLRKAEAALERLTKLHADKMASSEALEEARLNVELARAALKGDDLGFAQVQEQLRRDANRRSGGQHSPAQPRQQVPSKVTKLPTLASAPSTPPQPEQSVALGATRSVIDEWLGHVGADSTDRMWSLTTRELGMDTGIRKLADFKSIRAKHVLGSDTAAMVVSTRFKDEAARPRALLFTLVKQNARWLIRELLVDTPDNIQRRVEGFAAYPGVKFDVRPEDIVGEWKSGFLVEARHSFKPDGTGEQDVPKGEKRARAFRWEVIGDVFRTFGDQLDPGGSPATERRIVRMEDDVFAVRYADGNQWSYHRVAQASATPAGTGAMPSHVPGFIGFAFGPGDFREITSVVEGSPAAAAGLERGDYVIEIDGKPTTEIKDIKEFKELLRGDAGTEVKLSFRKARANKTVTLTLQRAELPAHVPSKTPTN